MQHNSRPSQIAEAYLKEFAGGKLEVEGAGLEPTERVNPLVVEDLDYFTLFFPL
jgi:protein-tyrosine-phosphatase